MNAVAPISSVRDDDIRALATHAHRQSRRSVHYRQWAREAAAAGKTEAAARWEAESRRYRADASFLIRFAISRKDGPLNA